MSRLDEAFGRTAASPPASAQHWHPCAARCGTKLWCTGAPPCPPRHCRNCSILAAAGVNEDDNQGEAPWFRLVVLGLGVLMLLGLGVIGYTGWVIYTIIARGLAG